MVAPRASLPEEIRQCRILIELANSMMMHIDLAGIETLKLAVQVS
jgi:hypothetical protein